MKKLFLLAGAGLTLALGAPAAADAKPGKGKAHAAKVHTGKVHTTARGHIDMNRNGVADWREQRLIDANGNGILDWRERRRVDINRNGIPDWREARIDRDRDGIDDRQEIMANRWGGATCPPGLEKKIPPCEPPGQVGRDFTLGQRAPTGWGTLPYRRIPLGVRDLYDLDDDDRYVYRNGTLYVVDPRTRMIERIIEAVVF